MTFLTSALGGTLFGKFLDIGSKWFDTYAARKQAEVDIMKAKALSELKIKEEELKAFTASQQAAAGDDIAIPSNTPPWVSSIAVLVDAFRRFTRPGLTWALAVVAAALAFFGELPVSTRDILIADLVFCMSTGLTWWFGSRPMARTTPTK
jgi:hypothetical protein